MRTSRIFAASLALLLAACGSDSPGDDSGAPAPGADVGGDVPGGDDADTPGDPDAPCVDDQAYFDDVLWPEVLGVTCANCHTAQGIARDSSLVFQPPAVANYLEQNRQAFAEVAELERDGVSIVLLKPLGELSHGGGEQIQVDSEPYLQIAEFVHRLDEPVVCEDTPIEDGDGDLDTLSPLGTLRKATLMLAGRLPTPEEYERVDELGEDGLRRILLDVMEEDAFYVWLSELWNDLLLTRAYEGGQNGTSLLDAADFPNRYWYDAYVDNPSRNLWRNRASDAIANEPLQLIAHVVREGRPFTEILTADYTMVNGYSAASYGIEGLTFEAGDDEDEALEFVEGQIADYPHTGILTMTGFLNRYPTTDTNRNRHRTWKFFDLFLASDILEFADRPIDPTVSTAHNPTLNDPQCTVCHTTMDPVAGLFQNWDDRGRLRPPDEGWYPDLAPPGFGDDLLPPERRSDALRFLAEHTVSDSRFGMSVVEHMYEGVIGRAVRSPVAVSDDDDGNPLDRDAFHAQRELLDQVAAGFESEDYDLKVVIADLILSDAFRAVGAGDAPSAELLDAGTSRLRTPEQLNRTIDTIFGYPWRNNPGDRDYLLNDFELLYGGIDSDGITSRMTQPNGIMANIGMRMGTELACRMVPRDFVLRAEDRRLFPFVEVSFTPETEDGFPVPQVEGLIRENMRYLLWHVLGEDVPADHEEIDAMYTLFFETWQEGEALVEAGEISENMPWTCQARSNYWTGEDFNDRRLQADPEYTVRAWMAVIAYLVTDYRFLYQ